ncbi:cytochrome P450 [Longispora albida]|uniref:cytochrome P450 n=1 Tax=Longispora albida TaxID=203523 RepID=UPI0003711508|nr:cytochrome P450 [Longispora albida]
MSLIDPGTYTSGVPYPELDRQREAAAVSWMAEEGGPGFWAVWRHAEVKAVLRDPATFSSALGATQIRDPATPADLAYVRRMMLNMDPPEHSRLRGLLTRSFTPRAVTALRGRIDADAAAIAESVRPGEVTDFVALTADLPLLTLAGVLGVPDSDRRLLYDWANRVIGFQDPDYAASDTVTGLPGLSPMAVAALRLRPSPGPDGRMPDPRTRSGIPDLYAYAHALAEHKRREPGTDVMSVLLAQTGPEGSVTTEEFENLFWLFAVAGNETVRNGLPGGMTALLADPALWYRLRTGRALLPAAVDEMLRWWCPVMHFRRTAARDTVLGGVPINAGDKVVVWFSAANRDPRVFAEPHEFTVDRGASDHLAFGHGPHFCLGAALARYQMTAMFAALLDRFATVEGAGEPVRLRSNFQNGLKRLPVVFT